MKQELVITRQQHQSCLEEVCERRFSECSRNHKIFVLSYRVIENRATKGIRDELIPYVIIA